MRRPETLDPAVERELAALDAALAGRSADAELAVLVAAVRDERPLPPPGFARNMDQRLEAGFPRQAAARRSGGRRRLRLGFGPAMAFAATMLVALVVATATLTGGDELAMQDSGAGGGSVSAQGESAGAGGARTAGEAADSAASPGLPMPAPPSTGGSADDARERRVERAATLVLTAPPDEIETVADRIIRATDAAGGFVQSSSTRTDEQSGGEGIFELRVPTARLERTLAELSRLAHVRDRSQTTQDITAEAVSAQATLSDALAERRVLRRQLDAAQTPRESERIRARLATVRRQIQAARAEIRRVDNRAAFATIAVTLLGDDEAGAGAVPGDGRWTPGEALSDALRVLETAAGVLLVALAVLVPLGVLALPVALMWRHGVRRRRERALDAV
jgi:hypothetical protein